MVQSCKGVLKVKADCSAKKLTVMGHVDPFLLRERVESKIKKKVELISYPQPKKGDEKSEKKSDDQEEKLPKQVSSKFLFTSLNHHHHHMRIKS